MKRLLFLSFVLLLAGNVAADVLCYRNGAEVSGEFIRFNKNMAYFLAGNDTLAVSGFQAAEIKLNNGGRVLFDPKFNKFFMKGGKMALPEPKQRQASVLLGVATAALAVNEIFAVREINVFERQIKDIGFEGSSLKGTKNRRIIMAAVFSVLSVISFYGTERDKEKP